MRDPVEAADYCFEHGCQMRCPDNPSQCNRSDDSIRLLVIEACKFLSQNHQTVLAYEISKAFDLKVWEDVRDPSAPPFVGGQSPSADAWRRAGSE